MGEPDEHKALASAKAGDTDAIGPILESYRDRLSRMVSIRMDRRAQGRFGVSDVLQEAFTEASQRLPEFLGDEKMPFFLWVRLLTGQKLLQLHRRHLGTEARAADRDVALSPPSAPTADAFKVASVWIAESRSPSQVMALGEEQARVREALEAMSEMDREVLVLRHFEQLTNAEISALLEIAPQAASARYVRALTRLQRAMGES